MIFPGSRYQNSGTYHGHPLQTATVVIKVLCDCRCPGRPWSRGIIRRATGQRLDLIANAFLSDATAFWHCATRTTPSCPMPWRARPGRHSVRRHVRRCRAPTNSSSTARPRTRTSIRPLTSLEVEESMDLPGAVQLNVPVNRSPSGDLTYVSDEPRFAAAGQPGGGRHPARGAGADSPAPRRAALGTALGGGGSERRPQCIFDGYILSHKLHLETGTTNSTLTVWGQDASWLMNLTEKVKEWVDVTDADVANAIFGDYGITPADDNTDDDSPSHTETGHSLMQRGSDIQFLRTLARRNGKICRVACADKPGTAHRLFRQAQPRRRSGGHPLARRPAVLDRRRSWTWTGT